jgi:uncharacterized protein (TIGR02145 family)
MLSNYRTGLTQKVNISDTASMLTNYRNGLNQKINLADTASMLNPYLRDADTIAMLTNYRTGLNQKVNISDTLNMLSNYRNGLNQKINIADTSNMLSNYRTTLNQKVNIADTVTMLNPYFKKADTTSLNLTNRFNAKVNLTDFPQATVRGSIRYWNGNNWVILAPGSTGQTLIMSSSTGTLGWGCIITNTAGAASSAPTLNANTVLTPITHSTTGATGIGTATGLPIGVTAAWSANLITISGTPSSAGTFSYSIPLSGGCGSVSAMGTITVNAVTATLTTTTIGAITSTGASSGGNITSDGGASITARGVVWSTSAGPTISLSTKTTDGTGTGTFTSTISGLTATTTYYARAYATNTAGTAYGNEVTFTTCTLNTAGSPSSSPTVTVNTALTPITISTTGATGIGTATGLPSGVSASWSANVITISGTPTATGSFTYTIPLTGGCGSVSATGTITVTVFTCGTSTVSDIDNNTYNTVSIGTQCWIKENLRVRRYNDGSEIKFDASGGTTGSVSGQTWGALTYGAHTIYRHDSTANPSNLTSYGYLYNWYAAKGVATSGSTMYKNICPSGWHIPSNSEWSSLTTFLGGQNFSGGKLKSTSTLWTFQGTGADNSSGFSGLPGGIRGTDGAFGYINGYAFFWSNSENGSLGVCRYLDVNNILVFNPTGGTFATRSVGQALRCLKD